jgi:p-aminobenzoyl-glutamate transporter AbgT
LRAKSKEQRERERERIKSEVQMCRLYPNALPKCRTLFFLFFGIFAFLGFLASSLFFSYASDRKKKDTSKFIYIKSRECERREKSF